MTKGAKMAVTVLLRISGMSKEVYDEMNSAMGLDQNHMPDGMLAHYAAATPDGIQIFDIWESAEAFARHGQQDVMPAMASIVQGAAPNLEPEIHELYKEFTR
jgi:hypothetical protein